MNINLAWSNFKSLSDSKGMKIQYQDYSNEYYLWALENGTTYICGITKTTPASSDQADFENNYKANSNLPINIGENIVFNALQIRNTSQHTSSISDNRGFVPKTIIVQNSLNQPVNIAVFGSRTSDFSLELQIGSSVDIAASTNDYMTLTDYFPYLRLKATCLVAPASGSLTIFLEKVKT